MPKAPAFSEPDDEKTTIESGWEEEASTTVEQGEVAEKIRQLGAEAPSRTRNGNTNVTSTSGHSIVDEPTVDDGRVAGAIALITPPNLVVARLLVTQGNDTGQAIEVAPGKSYTIGRAIDNDFVLTDIAVSRKHFDLRHENGSWVVADRGSGNGTVVNGNIEDHPFTLANGDLIEIGNTVFRFEQANGSPRPPSRSAGQYNIEADEEEPSTVAGKPVPPTRAAARPEPAPMRPEPPPPLRPDVAPVPTLPQRSDALAATAQLPPPRMRPKTVPPPAPMQRPRSTSVPPMAYPVGSQASAPALGALPGMPLARPPLPPPPPASQLQPQLLQPPLASQMLSPQQQAAPPLPATTLPMPQMTGMQGRPPVLAPGAPTMLGGDPLAARMAQSSLPTTIPGQGPPISAQMPMPPPHVQSMPFSYPSVSDLHKQLLVVGNGPPRDATSTALVQPTPYGAMPMVASPAYAVPAFSRRTKLLLGGAALTLLAAIATIAIMKGSESEGVASPEAGSGDGSNGATITPIEPSKGEAPTSEATKTEPSKTEPPKTEPPKTEPPKVAEATKTEPPRTEPPKTEPPKTEPPKAEPPKTEPPKTELRVEPIAIEDEEAPPKPEKPDKNGKKPARTTPTRPTTTPKTTNPPKRTAAITAPARADTSAARNRATELYRAKKFGEAAETLRRAASSLSGADANELKSAASTYEQLGRAYNRGMSPGAKPVEAYVELRRAYGLDSGSAPGEFTSEIKARLGQVAPKAAISYYVSKEYQNAFKAVRDAESNGVNNADTKLVRTKLSETASELYATAAKEINSNPEAAKAKLRTIRTIVDEKSPIRAKAESLLNSN